MLRLAGLVATAPAAMAFPASAAWTEQRLPGAAGLYVQPDVAANSRGDAAVVWGARPHRFLVVRPAGRARFGRPIALPARGKADRVAVLSDGTVLVGWLSLDGTARSGPGVRECCLVAYLQRLRPGSRRLSAPRAVTRRGMDLYGWSLVAGPGGRVALIGNSIEPVAGIYGGKRGSITLVTSRPGGSFGIPIKTTAGASRFTRPSTIEHLAAADALVCEAILSLAQASSVDLERISSSDGQRYPIIGRALARFAARGAGYRRRMVTWMIWINEQYAHFGSKAISVTEREGLHTLDAIVLADDAPEIHTV